MTHKQAIMKGTFILTLTGFATRFMGFFYRIFLSHTFGEECVGLYQLVSPIYTLCFSLTSAGIELALSRCVATRIAQGQPKEARKLLYTSLFLTVTASCITTLLLQQNAVSISQTFLQEPRCTDLLIILSYVFPFSSIHSCICGYYFGLKQTKIPAVSQLIEQTARIASVYFIYLYGERNGIHFGISLAVAGLIAGEITSSLFCLHSIYGNKEFSKLSLFSLQKYFKYGRELITLSLPLTGNRVLLNILQSIEAVSIPVKLQTYGMSLKDS